jgi:hypothetical protein
VQCEQVSDHLLLGEPADPAEIGQHLDTCSACARLARAAGRVDSVLHAALVVEPPPALQARLAALLQTAPLLARPPAATSQPGPWWRRTLDALRSFDPRVNPPRLVFAQGLALLAVALASWQVFNWSSSITPVVGDVGYAVELLAESPALTYVPGLQIDPGAFALWTLLGLAGWVASESGPLGRYLSPPGDHS